MADLGATPFHLSLPLMNDFSRGRRWRAWGRRIFPGASLRVKEIDLIVDAVIGHVTDPRPRSAKG
jgi:hypothetical protein